MKKKSYPVTFGWYFIIKDQGKKILILENMYYLEEMKISVTSNTVISFKS